MDKLHMEDIVFYGYHGVFKEENTLGQVFQVSISAELDLKQAGVHDDLNQTIHYAEVYEAIKAIVEGPPFKLIEAVAEAIASRLLANYAKIESITVRVRKPNPPFAIQFAGVVVEITRSR
jgi:dihydroneopterin aldolase